MGDERQLKVKGLNLRGLGSLLLGGANGQKGLVTGAETAVAIALARADLFL
jgi:hypothetical protein